MYLSPNSYELQGEYVRPPDRKFHVTIFKEAAGPDEQLKDKAVMIKVKKCGTELGFDSLNAAPLILLVDSACF